MTKKIILLFMLFPTVAAAFMSGSDVRTFQRQIAGLPAGERIALWAEKFMGTPYDPDPLGEYVRRKVIIADERVDCMYLTFRTVELALSDTPEGAAEIALNRRFINRGRIRDGKVINYEDRFQYGEDMIESGKWGKEVTGELGTTISVEGSRGKVHVPVMPAGEVLRHLSQFHSGDIIFFVRSPEKRTKDEIVGHMGIIKREGEGVYLIHASGRKNGEGRVKKVTFEDYLHSMPFIGIKVTRFDKDS